MIAHLLVFLGCDFLQEVGNGLPFWHIKAQTLKVWDHILPRAMEHQVACRETGLLVCLSFHFVLFCSVLFSCCFVSFASVSCPVRSFPFLSFPFLSFPFHRKKTCGLHLHRCRVYCTVQFRPQQMQAADLPFVSSKTSPNGEPWEAWQQRCEPAMALQMQDGCQQSKKVTDLHGQQVA